MDYIKKLEDLLSKKYSYREIAENLYLNYCSLIDTDEVYRIRKKLSQIFVCNLNDVRLIGSAHTGYSFKNDKLEIRDNPKDYDFAIIDPVVFATYFHKINVSKIEAKNIGNYTKYILQGKIHPLYADSKFLKEIQTMYINISGELGIKRHITVCFYLSEKAFIEGLVMYNHQLYTMMLKKINNSVMQELPEMVFKDIPKMEG